MSDAEEDSLLSDFAQALVDLQEKPHDNKKYSLNNTSFDKALLEVNDGSDSSDKAKSLIVDKENKGNELNLSDDEEFSNYNECGQSIKRLIDASSKESKVKESPVTWQSNEKKSTLKQLSVDASNKEDIISKKNQSVLFDPTIGLTIVKPLISSATLKKMLEGKEVVNFIRLKFHLSKPKIDNDWVIFGAVVSKFNKTSQKGNQYTVWTISDLQFDLKSVSLFLFGKVCKEFSKVQVGTIVGCLNPSILEKNSNAKTEVNTKPFCSKSFVFHVLDFRRHSAWTMHKK